MLHNARMDLIKTSLQTFLQALGAPSNTRLVTRNWQPLQQAKDADIKLGQYTIISVSESGYKNYNTAEALDAEQKILLIYRFKLGEKSTGEDVERAEWDAFDNEIGPWLRALPPDLVSMVVKRTVLSGQLLAPYGTVVCELEELYT